MEYWKQYEPILNVKFQSRFHQWKTRWMLINKDTVLKKIIQSAGAVEYTDCTSPKG